MTNEERLAKMHGRAEELAHHREKKKINALGGACAVLMVGLVSLIHMMQKLQHSITGNQPAGSSLLGDSVGGYVLVAVIAFVVGVVLTAVIRQRRSRTGGEKQDHTE